MPSVSSRTALWQIDPVTYLWVFSFCLVSLTFKQLKFTSFVGPMELVTAAVLGVGLIQSWRRGLFRKAQILQPIALGFVILNIGTLWALYAAPDRIRLREAVAYTFTFLLLVNFMAMARGRELQALRIVGTVIGLYLLVTVVLSVLPSPIQPYLWYYGVKFQALSDNPNQIAFLAIVGSCFLVGHEILNGPRGGLQITAAFGCALAGFASQSGAFYIAVLFILAVTITGTIVSKGLAPWPTAEGSSGPLTWRSAITSWTTANLNQLPATTFTILAAKATVIVGLFSADANFSERFAGIEEISYEQIMAGDAAQGQTRITLWENALKIALDSPVVGYGAGVHVPFQNNGEAHLYEAHNTALDVLVVSGLMGLGFLAIVAVWMIWKAVKTQKLYLLILIIGPIILYSMLHYVGRQPLFWIALTLATCLLDTRPVSRKTPTA